MESSTASEPRTFTRGKVRDVYDLKDRLLIFTSDRISAYDVILPDPIVDKGKILTAMSLFWFDHLGHVCPHHLISADVSTFPEPFKSRADEFAGR